MSVCKKPRLLAPPIMHTGAKPFMNCHFNVNVSTKFTDLIILKMRIDKFEHRNLKVDIFEYFISACTYIIQQILCQLKGSRIKIAKDHIFALDKLMQNN